MKKHTYKFLLMAIAITSLFAAQSCKKEKVEEGEFISKVEVILDDGTTIDTFSWNDPDGIGGNAALAADTIVLDSGRFYNAQIKFYNGNTDVTPEIAAEAKDHYVCYQHGNEIEIVATDSDGTYAIGLESKLKADKKGNFSIGIILKHQPGEKNGTCATGETDVDVSFPSKYK